MTLLQKEHAAKAMACLRTYPVFLLLLDGYKATDRASLLIQSLTRRIVHGVLQAYHFLMLLPLPLRTEAQGQRAHQPLKGFRTFPEVRKHLLDAEANVDVSLADIRRLDWDWFSSAFEHWISIFNREDAYSGSRDDPGGLVFRSAADAHRASFIGRADSNRKLYVEDLGPCTEICGPSCNCSDLDCSCNARLHSMARAAAPSGPRRFSRKQILEQAFCERIKTALLLQLLLSLLVLSSCWRSAAQHSSKQQRPQPKWDLRWARGTSATRRHEQTARIGHRLSWTPLLQAALCQGPCTSNPESDRG